MRYALCESIHVRTMFEQIVRLFTPADRLSLGPFRFGRAGLIGGALPDYGGQAVLDERALRHALRHAALDSLDGDEFNRGIRACCFGFAALAWLVSPGAFIAATVLILGVLCRRDFRAQTLVALVR